MTTDLQVKAWAAEAKRAFYFLEASGYQALTPRLDVTWGALTYLGAKLGVRVEFETDCCFMYVALFRPDRPEHDNSKYLQACLRRLDLPAELLQQVLALRGDFANLTRMVALFANSLRLNLSILESRVDSLFPL